MGVSMFDVPEPGSLSQGYVSEYVLGVCFGVCSVGFGVCFAVKLYFPAVLKVKHATK